MSAKITKKEKNSAIKYTAAIALFAILGVLIAVFLRPDGFAVMGPLLLGPGLTIFFFGALYNCSLGPLLGFEHSIFAKKLRYAYLSLGGLFIVMGLFAWVLG